MGKIPWLLFLPPLIFLGLALLFYTGMQREDPNRLLSTLIGQAAPPITTARLSNFPEFEQSQLVSGGVTLVNFWASWCPPCRAMAPAFHKASEELSPDFLLAKLSTEEAPEISQSLNIQGIPCLIGFQKGAEVGRQSGAMTAEQIGIWVRALPWK